jgi:hypothetical protein
MKKTTFQILAALLTANILQIAPAQADTAFSADFNSNDGGFVSTTYNPIGGRAEGPWIYGATSGLNGSGGWSALGDTGGEQFGVVPADRYLTSPVITLSSSGAISLSFDHLYDFEIWQGKAGDGGAINISINGGAFTQIPTASFSQNGYNQTIGIIDDWGYPGDMNGLPVFAGYSGDYIKSQANLGNFNAGDTLQIQFRGGWDWNGTGDHPEVGWHVDNVTVSSVPVPAAVWLFGSAMVGLIGFGKSRKFFNA